MLVLTRKKGEAIYIGDNVKVIYLGHNDYNGAKIGIEAPTSIPIARNELIDEDYLQGKKNYPQCKIAFTLM